MNATQLEINNALMALYDFLGSNYLYHASEPQEKNDQQMLFYFALVNNGLQLLHFNSYCESVIIDHFVEEEMYNYSVIQFSE